MKLEKPFLIIALLAIVISLPTAYAISKRTSLLNIERSQKQQLQLDIKSKEDLLREQQLKVEQEHQQKQELEKQNHDSIVYLKIKQEIDKVNCFLKKLSVKIYKKKCLPCNTKLKFI